MEMENISLNLEHIEKKRIKVNMEKEVATREKEVKAEKEDRQKKGESRGPKFVR